MLSVIRLSVEKISFVKFSAGNDISGLFADVAQLAEHSFRKAGVVSSSLTIGIMADKLAILKQILYRYKRLAIGFSGGLDSGLLAAVAVEVLAAENVMLFMARGPIIPQIQIKDAEAAARELGLGIKTVNTNEMQLSEFVTNDPLRCYYCKKNIFGRIKQAARELGFENVACGTNVDDYDDYRPGNRAIEELGVVCPLAEAGMTKSEIRRIAKDMGLKQADKPSTTCLATRFPYNTVITNQALRQIESAEESLMALGFSGFRVRYYGQTARIELPAGQIPRMIDESVRQKVCESLKQCGFTFVSLDLEGFKSGSLNRVLRKPE